MWIRIGLLVVGLLFGGWMTFDGTRALVSGDYTTPKSGPHAGQLGPWAQALRAAGIEPRSVAVKWFFVLWGLAWLASAIAHFAGAAWGWPLLAGLSLLSLWYFPAGTVLALLHLALLLVLRYRMGG